MSFNVTVKYGKEKHNVDMDTNGSALIFKNQIYSLTKVPPTRQKIMFKGGNLKDDTDLKSIKGLKNGFLFMMTGTADEDLPVAPTDKVAFVEDQPNLAVENTYTPPGLENLGNTCYMNSSLQALRSIPELRFALKKYSETNKGQKQHATITNEMKKLFTLLDNSSTVPPITFTNTLRQVFPQFDERQGENGPHLQQDADECFTQLLKSLGDQLGSPISNNLIKDLFVGEFQQTVKNVNNPDEKETTKSEEFEKLACHIDNNTSFLMTGLKAGLEERIEKNSPLTNELAEYKQSSKISQLPYYLKVQFVRFYWKKNVKVSKNAPMGVKSKIVHPVEFPLTLDLFDLCTEEYQGALKKERQEIHNIEEKILEKQREDIKKGLTTKQGKAEQNQVVTPPAELDSLSSDKMKNTSGLYELFAVISHKGRTADGGHYVAWVKQDKDLWVLYDDDQISYVRDDDIKKLSGHGGADWHISYVCLYRSKPKPTFEEVNSKDEMQEN